jgi:hypothetical protein
MSGPGMGGGMSGPGMGCGVVWAITVMVAGVRRRMALSLHACVLAKALPALLVPSPHVPREG